MEKIDLLAAKGAPGAVASALPGTQHGSYVDWAAILGGAMIAVALGVLFTGFGTALGLTAISVKAGDTGSVVPALAISAIWIVLSMVAAYAVGGYVAGRMRRRVDAASREEITVRDGFNGLIVWAVGIVLGAVMLGSVVSTAVATAGSVAATGAEIVGNAAGAAAGGAINAAAGMLPQDPMTFVTGALLRPTTVTPTVGAAEPATADAGMILANVVTTGALSDPDRAYLVQLTAARTGLTPAEVDTRVDQAVTAAQDARAEAQRLATEAEAMARASAETARISAILTAFLLTATALVSAGAAYVCAVRGGRHRDEGRVFGGLAYRR